MHQRVQEAIGAGSGESEILDTEAIRAAIEGFGDVDWLRLKRAADYFAWRTGVQGCDLLQEVMTRALEGRRKCPRNTKVITFLCNAIRSIASEDDSDIQQVPLEGKLEFDPDDGAKLCDPSQSPERAAQGRIDGKRLFTEVLGLFDDDETAKLMFEGMMEEMEGEELREFLGLTSTEFDSKRRLVRRRLNNHFEGRRP
ncbi:MAG: hypothetical protein C0429_08760 [Sphingopyxis sp.]|nr:hypothetical protein [Sphingopyxis sp.]